MQYGALRRKRLKNVSLLKEKIIKSNDISFQFNEHAAQLDLVLIAAHFS